jgi:hypothetical protein
MPSFCGKCQTKTKRTTRKMTAKKKKMMMKAQTRATRNERSVNDDA